MQVAQEGLVEVTEHERHQLFGWFEEHMGQERAATMMKVIQPEGWSDVLTKRDLLDVEGRLDARFVSFEARMNQRFAEFETRVTRTFVGWMLGSQAVMVAVVGLLVGLR
jgi:hypothetical protein